MTCSGILLSCGPNIAATAASTASAAAAPERALRQPRTLPTASTTVNASTHSTRDARNDATTVVPTRVQLADNNPNITAACVSDYDGVHPQSIAADETHIVTRSPSSHFDRRAFCSAAASILVRPSALLAQAPPVASTRPDVATIDHERILSAAARYLDLKPAPLTSLPCPRSPASPHDYYSEASRLTDGDAQPAEPLFTAHRDALFQLGLAVPALAAAFHLTGEARYVEQAVRHLRAWFIDPDTQMVAALKYAQVQLPIGRVSRNAITGRYEGLVEALPLVEVAQAIPFLAASPVTTDADIAALRKWFGDYLAWLTGDELAGARLPALARDSRDHHGTSWMLQVCAYSTFAAPESSAPRSETSSLTQLRHRYRSTLLRAQVSARGTFPRELTAPNAFRDSLFNLDMLAAICQLLQTRFDSVWDYELQDGPGMRAAIAFHYPFIADPKTWPYRADAEHFDELPGRRPSLLFCARAYQRPEYAETWKTLRPDPPSPDVLRTIPLHQPLLWVRQPPRRAET